MNTEHIIPVSFKPNPIYYVYTNLNLLLNLDEVDVFNTF